MAYTIKETYYTIQGEGAQVGRAAVFLRFSGCNLWSGHERDRATAVCDFCDTDFVGTDGPGGGKYDSAEKLADAVAMKWSVRQSQLVRPLVVCTGGEPLLQLDASLIATLHARGFEIAVETNGTILPPQGIDWLCVSPKAGVPLAITAGDELKLVYPQAGLSPEAFTPLDFKHFFLQPKDGADREQNTRLVVEYCLAHPQWRVSFQLHKLIGVP